MSARYVPRAEPGPAPDLTDGACQPHTRPAHLGADDWFPHTTHREDVERVRAVCHECPVIARCRAYAIAHPSLEGVWGGTTQSERVALAGGVTPAGVRPMELPTPPPRPAPRRRAERRSFPGVRLRPEALEELREDGGHESDAALARAAGLSPSTFSNARRRGGRASGELVAALILHTGQPFDDLFTLTHREDHQ